MRKNHLRKTGVGPKTPALPSQILPGDIIESDTAYPAQPKNWKTKKKPSQIVVDQFTLSFVKGFGWCISTLHIRRSRRVDRVDRTYGVSVHDQKPVRFGLGPHVLRQVTVYVTEARLPKLQRFLTLRNEGAQTSHMIRDRISSRRAQTALRRGGGDWDGADILGSLLGRR